MRRHRFARPPRALRRRSVHLDNVALVPASLLPFKDEWQAVANGLPAGGVLVCLPRQEKHRRIVRSVATQLRARGTPVAVVGQPVSGRLA